METSGGLFDCSPLGQFNGGFEAYIHRLRNQTGFNKALLAFCDSEICGALWGVGNPDVSGIGVCHLPIKAATHPIIANLIPGNFCVHYRGLSWVSSIFMLFSISAQH